MMGGIVREARVEFTAAGSRAVSLELDAAAASRLASGATALVSWVNSAGEAQAVDMRITSASGTVSGSVPATLSLLLGAPATFGAFQPGVARDYFATTSATVISTAGDATLSVADPSSNATGRLVNGSFSLAQPLQAGTFGNYAAVGGLTNPTAIHSYSGPVSNDQVTIGFKQSIGANEPLRTGTYAKTLTFTLSTTNP
jgi:hypothetical protein